MDNKLFRFLIGWKEFRSAESMTKCYKISFSELKFRLKIKEDIKEIKVQKEGIEIKTGGLKVDG